MSVFGSSSSNAFGHGDQQRQSTYGQQPPPPLGFSVAGISNAQLSTSQWGTSTQGGGLGGSLSESRSHYTAGYIMPPPGSSNRFDETPTIPTRAKMNSSFVRGSASEFGNESMFQVPRRRPMLSDEDAPPTASVNDIPADFSPPSRSKSKMSQSVLRESALRSSPRSTKTTQSQEPLYVVVFGFPLERKGEAEEFFTSLGESTVAESNAEIINAFRIGYKKPTDALRAMRKNGEVLQGNWMIGVKWANAAEAERLLGAGLARGVSPAQLPSPPAGVSAGEPMAVDDAPPEATPLSKSLALTRVGTPLRLAPADAAYKKTGAAPAPAPGWSPTGPAATLVPAKGFVGQVSDLIFGW